MDERHLWCAAKAGLEALIVSTLTLCIINGIARVKGFEVCAVDGAVSNIHNDVVDVFSAVARYAIVTSVEGNLHSVLFDLIVARAVAVTVGINVTVDVGTDPIRVVVGCHSCDADRWVNEWVAGVIDLSTDVILEWTRLHG